MRPHALWLALGTGRSALPQPLGSAAWLRVEICCLAMVGLVSKEGLKPKVPRCRLSCAAQSTAHTQQASLQSLRLGHVQLSTLLRGKRETPPKPPKIVVLACVAWLALLSPAADPALAHAAPPPAPSHRRPRLCRVSAPAHAWQQDQSVFCGRCLCDSARRRGRRKKKGRRKRLTRRKQKRKG